MLYTYGSFFRSMKGHRITLIGIGVSHTALIEKLCKAGSIVTVLDRRAREAIGEELCTRLESMGATLCLGEDYLEHMDGEIIFRTPGMKFLTPALTAARQRGAVVTSELELFLELCPCPVYGITGSDGKTTTATLIAKLLESTGRKVHLGGNIGRALLPIVDEVSADDFAVVELSSFQLISMRHSPDVAVVTNLAPNHLDIHADMQEYIDAKKNVLLHQGGFGHAVFNADNEIAASFAPLARGAVSFFSRRHTVARGAFVDEGGWICAARDGVVTPIMPAGELRLPGLHNLENMLAAISAVWGMVSPAAIVELAHTFGGVEHRIEFVRELDGVRWYNDSIATSPTRTIAGLMSFDRRLIIIAGGYDKKIPFEPLGPVVSKRVKILILTGPTTEKIEAAVRGAEGFSEKDTIIIHADNLSDAVQKARNLARDGDIVSLCPACASFDAYPNFEARGRHFKELVTAL